MTPEQLAKYATKYRIAMIRLGAKDADFIACGVDPPSAEEYARISEMDGIIYGESKDE